MKSMKIRCAVLACLALAMGCSRSTTYKSKDGSVTVEQKSGDTSSIVATDKDGKTVTVNIGGGKIPDDYPKDLPIYPGAKTTAVQSTSEKHMVNLMLESGDAMDKIAGFYKSGLESNGWKIENSISTAQMTAFTAAKDNRQAILQILDASDKRNINQTTSDK